VAGARLALAEGDPERAAEWFAGAEGLRRRTGSVTWPSMRQDEAALAAAISDALPDGSYERISAGGSTLTRREAIGLLTRLGSTDGERRGG
jgi:hypothetical protein